MCVTYVYFVQVRDETETKIDQPIEQALCCLCLYVCVCMCVCMCICMCVTYVYVIQIRDETETKIDQPIEQADCFLIVITGTKESVEKARTLLEASQTDVVSVRPHVVSVAQSL